MTEPDPDFVSEVEPQSKAAAHPSERPDWATISDVGVIERLAAILARHGLTELRLDCGGLRVRMARPVASTSATTPLAALTPATEVIRSPIAGLAYLRLGPEAAAFVEVGSIVEAGDRLMLVEAGGAFHNIASPRAGKVAAVLIADDGAAVAIGQPLIQLEAR